jgi:hypothetical protein
MIIVGLPLYSRTSILTNDKDHYLCLPCEGLLFFLHKSNRRTRMNILQCTFCTVLYIVVQIPLGKYIEKIMQMVNIIT